MTINRIRVTLCITAVCVALLGCGPSIDEERRLDVWTPFSAEPMNAAFKAIVTDFNEAQNEFVVVHTPFDDSKYGTVVKTSFLGGSSPDVMLFNPGGIMFQYAEAGLLTDLTVFVDEREHYIQDDLTAFYDFEDRSYGMPFELHVGNLLYYNKDILQQIGTNEDEIRTWAGFLVASQNAKDNGIWPIAFGNLEGWPGSHIYNHLLLRSIGPDRYNRIFLRTFEQGIESDLDWEDSEPLATWSRFLELRDRGYFSPGYLADTYATANSLFLTGRAAFFINGSWFAGDLASKAPELNWGVMPFPVVREDADDQMDLVISGLVASISSESPHKERAKRFLDYLASEPVQRQWAEANQRLSPYKYDNRSWNYSEQFRRIAELERKADNIVLFGDMLEDFSCNKPWFWDAGQGILIDSISPEEIGRLHEECVRRVRLQRGFEKINKGEEN